MSFNFGSIVDRFLMPSSTHKTYKIIKHSFVFQILFIALSKLPSIFDPILVPTCLHFPSNSQSKMHQNCDLEGIHLLIDVCIDFPSIWDANLGLCWPLRRAQYASKTPPRRLQRRSARHFSLQRWCWSIFGRCLVDFWSTNNQTLSAVAGTQLCCALDPPRQALRPAHGV